MRISLTKKIYALTFGALLGTILIGALWQRKELSAVRDFANEDLLAFLTTTLFRVGGQPVRVFFLIKTALFLFLLTVISRLTKNALRTVFHQYPQLDQHRAYLITRSVSALIYIAGILVGVQVERINLGTLAVIAGSLGVGAGFGLQPLVSNFVAGVVLLAEQPLRLGDRIEFGEKSGTVVRVGIRSSWIQTYANAILIVPNSDLVTKQILNWNVSDPKILVSLPVPVAYGTDPDSVFRILLDIAHHRDVLTDPPAESVLSELGPYSITFMLRVWTLKQADELSSMKSDILIRVLKRFREEHIEIPLPRLDLQVRPHTF